MVDMIDGRFRKYVVSFSVNFLCKIAVIFCASTSGGDVHVIDGDGFTFDGRTVRIWGIDAPELTQECGDASGKRYACGKSSKAFLSEIFGDSVPICQTIDRDRFGRDVSRCEIDGQDVGRAMVQAGWAVDYTRFSGGTYQADQRAAQAERIGLWSGSFDMPWDWRNLSR